MPVYLLNLQGAAKETTMGELLPFAFGLEEGKKFLMWAETYKMYLHFDK